MVQCVYQHELSHTAHGYLQFVDLHVGTYISEVTVAETRSFL